MTTPQQKMVVPPSPTSVYDTGSMRFPRSDSGAKSHLRSSNISIISDTDNSTSGTIIFPMVGYMSPQNSHEMIEIISENHEQQQALKSVHYDEDLSTLSNVEKVDRRKRNFFSDKVHRLRVKFGKDYRANLERSSSGRLT